MTLFTSPDVKGFSLVELLVVVAVVGLLAAIAIPNIFITTQNAQNSATARTAQTVAMTYNAAVAAGLPTNAASDVREVMTILASGTNVTVGGITNHFSVSGLTTNSMSDAETYLQLNNGLLTYSSTGNF